ncbi:MAG: flagellar hook-basal body protein [Desulfitobacteriaceae bacterium]
MHLIGTAASGIRAQQLAMDTVADNIANTNTIGFKASQVSFAETLKNVVRPEKATLPIGVSIPDALSVGAGVILNGVGTDFSQGPISTTENIWDLNIEGEGFFQVIRPNGETAYTRAGSFRTNANGQLQDSQGNLLAGGIPSTAILVPKEATEVSVSTDGELKGVVQGITQAFGQITLAGFANQEGLFKVGDNLYTSSANSGDAVIGFPGQNLGIVHSKALEQSNVNLGSAMTDLIQVQRVYQLNSRMVQDGDRMWDIANTIRR